MFKDVFDPIIFKLHSLPHTSDMDGSKIEGNIHQRAPIKSTRFGYYLN